MTPYGDAIVAQISHQGRMDKADWWNSYLKGTIPFHGLGIPGIRKLLLNLNHTEGLDRLPMNQQVSLVNGLIKGDYAEEKLAAVLFVQLFWLGRQKNRFLLNLVSDWFDERLIYDWNTTDWISVKLITPMVDSGDDKVIWVLKRWNRDSNLWKARASLVAFAQAKTIERHKATIERFCDILVRRDERFAKTAVGWVLREVSKSDVEFVLSFLSRHVRYTTSEVKRNALRYYRTTRREV